VSAVDADQDRAWIIDTEHGGTRADVVLATLLGESRSAARGHIDAGRFLLDDVVVRASAKVTPGQVALLHPAPVRAPMPTPAMPPIRFEDEHLLVIDKPSGLVVHAGVGHEGDTLVDAMIAEGVTLAPSAGEDRPGIVHRIDRDTSGLLLVAKTDAVRENLADQLRDHSMGRHYITLVEGSLPGPKGRVDAPLGRHPGDRTRFAVVDGGRAAVTHWREMAAGDADGLRVTLVACRLETGRTHQIRVHLSEAGNPILGDMKYGARLKPAVALGLERMFLHAASLAFNHPISGERMRVRQPLPDDLRAAALAASVDPDLDVLDVDER
jgi:23S rRNA pseudouridine1911/1915/1917 synthase